MFQKNRIKLKHEINYIYHILLKLWKASKQKNTVGLKTKEIIWQSSYVAEKSQNN